jgi:hypothetical protein
MNTVNKEVWTIPPTGMHLFTRIYIIPATELRTGESKNIFGQMYGREFSSS